MITGLDRHACEGEPPGTCGVTIPSERRWCRACTAKRQEALAAGLPLGIPTPVGIILQDFDAPRLMCECGGDATGFRHEQSLLHRQWAFALTGGRRARRR